METETRKYRLNRSILYREKPHLLKESIYCCQGRPTHIVAYIVTVKVRHEKKQRQINKIQEGGRGERHATD